MTIFFIVAMLLQVPKYNFNPTLKMMIFVGWAAYGVIPTFHWVYRMGGLENPVVAVSKETYWKFKKVQKLFQILASFAKSLWNVHNQRHSFCHLHSKNPWKIRCRKIRLPRTFSSVVARHCRWSSLLLAQFRNNLYRIQNESRLYR